MTLYHYRLSDSHILGQKVQRGKTEGMLQVLVMVENRRENAYEAMLNMTLPSGVSFFRITGKEYVSVTMVTELQIRGGNDNYSKMTYLIS